MTRCAHCEVVIVDPTTQVVHGDLTYCCPNCSEAMEHTRSGGSDRRPLEKKDLLRCAHCATPIVDDATMDMRGDQVFCCTNCAAAMPART